MEQKLNLISTFLRCRMAVDGWSKVVNKQGQPVTRNYVIVYVREYGCLGYRYIRSLDSC